MGLVLNKQIKTFAEYESEIIKTWGGDSQLERALLGLLGEAGELCEARKKFLRGDFDKFEYKNRLIKELGDMLYYLGTLARLNGISLTQVASENVEKILSRKKRGMILGDGDDR